MIKFTIKYIIDLGNGIKDAAYAEIEARSKAAACASLRKTEPCLHKIVYAHAA